MEVSSSLLLQLLSLQEEPWYLLNWMRLCGSRAGLDILEKT
jgi:hypothetical protein